MLSYAYLWCSSSLLRCCLFQYHELLGIAYLHHAYIGLLCFIDWTELYTAVLCCAVLLGLLSHDEISFDLHSLDRLVSTRFHLIALLSRLAGY